MDLIYRSWLAACWLDSPPSSSGQYEPWCQVSKPLSPSYLSTCCVDAMGALRYFAAIVVASWPYTHPLNIAWMSENMGSTGKRTIASGAVIGFANIYGSASISSYHKLFRL